jgi:glycosyltransferase involved in cell wall biosynthesis
MKKKILLFIPMYNCEKQIVRVLGQLTPEIQKYLSEVIIVNNRSTDNGEKAVENYIKQITSSIPFTLLRNTENYGLGGSHKVAFNYAIRNSFDYIIVLHGDDQGHIEDLLPYLRNGEYSKHDCFLGARFQKGAKLEGYSGFRTFGNRVYNLLFSIVVRKNIYDLGSGLNMYSVNMLKNKFYLKYKDNLMFNYCMILGSDYYKLNMKFFPIRWSEDDQVSNVKMINQAIIVLKLLGAYFVNKSGFIQKEHRDNPNFKYEAEVIYSNEQ